MSLKVTVTQLRTAIEAIVVLSACSIPNVKGSYALTKLRRQAAAANDDVEKTRISLCERHAVKKDGVPVIEGGQYVFADKEAFAADWQKLLAETVELPGCRPITLDEIAGVTNSVRNAKGEIETVEGVSPNLLDALGPFIVEAAA